MLFARVAAPACIPRGGCIFIRASALAFLGAPWVPPRVRESDSPLVQCCLFVDLLDFCAFMWFIPSNSFWGTSGLFVQLRLEIRDLFCKTFPLLLLPEVRPGSNLDAVWDVHSVRFVGVLHCPQGFFPWHKAFQCLPFRVKCRVPSWAFKTLNKRVFPWSSTALFFCVLLFAVDDNSVVSSLLLL